jgi:hypothetical protein
MSGRGNVDDVHLAGGAFGHFKPFRMKAGPKLDAPSETPRMSRLRALSGDRQAEDVPKALRKVWSQGLCPQRVLFRRQFARLDTPASSAYSDRKLPPPQERPPSTRLIKPRGVAQSLYLTVLFVAQCEREGGQLATTDRRLTDPTPRPHLMPWADLLMIPAGHRIGGKGHQRADDNRVRQLHEGLRLLASNEMRLVDLPRASASRDKLEGFVPLIETGVLERASRPHYRIPAPTGQLFSVPANFFINGWHSALSTSEVAMLFALWAASPNDSAGSSRVWLEGETRIRRYGLSPAAYSSQALLQAFGVLAVHVPNERRPDGTFVGMKKGDSPLLNSFTVNESGFDKPAVPTVMATLKAQP